MVPCFSPTEQDFFGESPPNRRNHITQNLKIIKRDENTARDRVSYDPGWIGLFTSRHCNAANYVDEVLKTN